MPDYKEYLFDVCSKTDLKNEEDVIQSLQFLSKEALMYHDLSIEYEEKLKEYMTAKEYGLFVKDFGQRMFKKEVEMMEDSDFKSFILENMDIITN